MAGKRRSPTSTLVSKNSIQKASTALVDLPEKPKEIWSLREAIDALKDQIGLALDRGYTYPEISQMLTQRGVEISASTLKYYLSSVKRASDPTAKTRRRRRTLSNRLNLDDLSLDMDTPEEEPEAVKVPAKRGRKPKAVAEAMPVVAKVPGKRGRKSAATKAAEAAAAEAAAAASPTAEPEAPVRKKPGRKPKSESATAAPVAKVKGKVGRPAKSAKVGRPATKGKVGRPPKAASAAAPKVAKAPRVAKAAKPAKATPKATVKGTRGRKKAI
jgi:hypothetical protein